VEVLNVIGIDGANAFDAELFESVDVLAGTTQIISVLQVGNRLVPINQFNNVSSPDACAEDHYHVPDLASPPAISCSGQSVSDPDQFGCGFGAVSDTKQIRLEDCANPGP
jgi:hypothetical protein